MVKYTTALRLGTAQTEDILRGFDRSGLRVKKSAAASACAKTNGKHDASNAGKSSPPLT